MDLLRLALLAAVATVVPATFLVGAGPRPRLGRRAADTRPGWGRLAPALALVALGGCMVGIVLGAAPGRAVAVGLVLAATLLAWRPLARGWSARGLTLWALGVDAGVLYLAYVLAWTLGAELPLSGLLAGLALWGLEVFVFLIGLGHLWEFVDVLGRRAWAADVDPAALTPAQRQHRPFVSLHVPTHNEPPEMVIETLERLLALEYDDYEILLVDNNTADPALWRPVEEFCARHDRLTFIHLENWPGYKSGALNHALTRTDPRAELIGIVDADYHVEPDFLADCAPLFAAPEVAFVQTPQDYREWDHAPYFRRLYHSYRYFFDVSQRSRNERNGAIFGGTMGLIRRSALEHVGGWDEWCITEDAELSLRMLKAGDRGVHVDRAYGRGVMPLTFEALKRQRFRWCFGGVQILRMHARSLLPGPRTEANQLSAGQRWAYLVGALQWFADLAGLAFTGFLLLGAVDALTGDGVIVRRLSGLILVGVVVLLVLGALRALALLRRAGGASAGEALGAFGVWLALGWAVALAAARGLVAREGAFLRTPKVRGELRGRDALRGNRAELALATACLLVGGAAATVGLARAVAPAAAEPAGGTVGAAGALAVGLLLLLQGAGYAAAPLNSLAAIRADLPAELQRRRLEALLSWVPGSTPARRGGGLLVAGGVAVAGLLVAASPTAVPDLADLPGAVDEGEQAGRDEPVPGVELTPATPGTSEPPELLAPVTLSPRTRDSTGDGATGGPAPAGSEPGGDGAAPATQPGDQPASQAPANQGGGGSGSGSGSQPGGGSGQTASPSQPSQAAEPDRPTQARGTPAGGRSNAPAEKPGQGNRRDNAGPGSNQSGGGGASGAP